MGPKEVVQAWAGAFNERAVNRLAALYADDATNFQVADEPIHGRSAIIDGFGHLFHGFPDIAFRSKTAGSYCNGAAGIG